MYRKTFTVEHLSPVYSVYLNACSNDQFRRVSELHHSNDCAELLWPPTDSLRALNFDIYRRGLFTTEDNLLCRGEFCKNSLHCLYKNVI